MKKSSGVAWGLCISIVCVWFTTQFGGGWASGMQAYQWFAMHGWMGLFMPLIGMAIIGGIGFITIEYARRQQTWHYRAFMQSLYGSRIVGIIHEITMLVGMPISAGALIATAGSTAASMFGMNYWVAVLIYSAIVILGCMYGEEMVRRSATIMGAIIVVLLLTIFIIVIINRHQIVDNYVAEKAVFTNWSDAWFNALKFGATTSAMVLSLLPVMQKLGSTKEASVVAFGGFAANSVIIMAICYIMLAFMPDVVGAPVPMLFAASNLNMPIMQWIYVIVLYLALITTGIGMLYTYVVRFSPVLEKRAKIKSEKARAGIIIAVILGISALISAAGLYAIIAQGYNVMALMNLPLVTFGIPIVGIYKLVKMRKREKEELKPALTSTDQ